MTEAQEGTLRILATTDRTNWHGTPFDLIVSPASGDVNGEPYDCYWLSVTRKGKCDVDIQTGRSSRHIRFGASSFAAYNPGLHWNRLSFRGAVESINFRFAPNALEDQDFLGSMPPLGNFPCAQDALVLTLAESMLAELRQGCPSGRLYSESLSLALAARLAGLTREATGRRSSHSTPRLSGHIARVISEFIEENLDQDLSIARLAALAAMTANNFCACFKGTFGVTVHQYVVQHRLARCKVLLESDMSLAEIALECGFSNQSRFTEAFRKTFGTTPARYRAELRITIGVK